MDVFALRDRLIQEYRQYVSGFVSIKEPAVRKRVEQNSTRGTSGRSPW